MFVKWSGPIRGGRQVHYLQIVESYIKDGKHLHRLIANLGELSQKQVKTLVKSFNRLLDEPYDIQPPAQKGRHRSASERRA